MDVRFEPQRRLSFLSSIEEMMLLKCGVGEDLRVPWTARISNQSILKETNPEFIGRPDAEADIFILWPPNVKS